MRQWKLPSLHNIEPVEVENGVLRDYPKGFQRAKSIVGVWLHVQPYSVIGAFVKDVNHR